MRQQLGKFVVALTLGSLVACQSKQDAPEQDASSEREAGSKAEGQDPPSQKDASKDGQQASKDDGATADDDADSPKEPACPDSPPPTPREALLMPSHKPVLKGEAGWQYVEKLRADLDGDEQEETLWVMARTEVVGGKPMWDDGQPWQVYVEEDSGETTHLFAGYVQLAQLQVSLLKPEASGHAVLSNEAAEPPDILLDASGPSTAVMYRVRYEGPDEFNARTLLEEGNVARPEVLRDN